MAGRGYPRRYNGVSSWLTRTRICHWTVRVASVRFAHERYGCRLGRIRVRPPSDIKSV